MQIEPTDWGSSGPDALWFDEWPMRVGVLVVALLVGFALFVGCITGLRWLGWALVLASVPIPLVRNHLQLDLCTRNWRHKRGLWPAVQVLIGGFDQLYGIEITKLALLGAPRYIASLHWQPGVLPKKRLYSSNSFDRVARPAVTLAAQLGVPIVLSHDMAVFYAARLDNIKSGVAYVSPLP